MPVYAILGFFASFLATIFLWTGLALSYKIKNNSLEYKILEKRFKHILLPVCLVLFVPCAVFLMTTLYGSIFAYGMAAIWVAAVLTLGIYCSISFSAMWLNISGKLTYIKWFLLTLLFYILFSLIGFFVLVFLVAIGDGIEGIIYLIKVRNK